MEIEIYLVSLMALVTICTLVGAINSKGAGRMITSYIFAFICVAVTGVFITQMVVGGESGLVNKLEKEKQDLIQAQEEKDKTLAEEKALANKNSEELAKKEAEENQKTQTGIKAYKNEVGALVEKLRTLNRKVSRVNLSVESDDAYEQLRGTANAYLGQANRLKKETKKLTVPEGAANIQSTLIEAIKTQSRACSNLRAYFNAEDEDQEETLSRAYKSRNSQATKLISSILDKL